MRARVPLASGFLALTLFVACGDDKKGDHTAPVVTIDAPAAGAVVGASVHVSGTVVDPQGKGEVKPSGVVAVTVHGVAATLSDGAFAADLSDLPAGALSIDVAATDAKGNVGTAQVAVTVSPAVALIVDPFTVRLEASGQTQAISVKAMAADGAQRPIAAADLTFDMLDASVASVGADGVVTAVADGITKLRVQGAGAEAQVTIAVVLDSEPPGEPSILSYLPETNGASEGWIGRTEPYAKVVIQGAATPVAKVADERGHFYADVPLTAGRMNDVAVVLTDVNGNVSRAYPFPIRQNAAAIDRGMLHVSFGRAEVAFGAELEGIAGEVLPHPMMARATDNDGRPLTNTEVEFTITSGAGSLSTVGPTEAVPGGVARAMATTDSEGYARVWWRLSPSALDENELLARLPGDLGVPILWQATGLFASSGHATIAGRVEDEFGLGEKDLLVQLTTGGTPTRTDELGEFLLDVPDDVFTSPSGAIAGSSGRVVTVLLNADASGGGAQVTRNTYPLTVFPGRENRPLGAFNLPRLPVGTALQLDATGHVTQEVTLSSQITGQQLPTKLHVPVGTLVTFPEGLPAERRRLAIIQVPINATPMPMPDGYFTSYIIGVQPGGTTFDPPLPIEIPNVDDYPPGSEVDLRAWDHTLARYVDSGRGTVSEDAGYILSDPGAGIRMGAWHGATRKPDDPCYVTYTVTDPGVAATADQHEEVDLPKDDEQDCVCKINGVASACELDKKGDPGRPPRSQTIRAPCNNNNFPGPRPPDPKKPDEPLPAISVECKPKKKGIKITYPAKTKEPYTVRIGTEVPFHAQCEDGKSDGSIQWQAAGGTATNLSGPSIKVKFEKKGKFTVSASGTTKTCKGSDTRVIEVLDCVDAGQVRVCGDKITDLGGGKYTVGPSATIGVVKPTATDDLNPVPVDPDHAGQFLRCNAVVNVAPDKVSASCALSMDIGLAAITSRVLNDVIIYQGAFEISGDRNIKLTIANYEGPQKGFQYDIAGLPLALTNTPVVLMPDGIGIDTPDLQFFKPKETVVGSFNSGYDIKECGKVPITDTDGEKMYVPGCDIAGVTEKKVLAPDQITAALTGLFLSPTRTSVSASFSWTREIEFKIGALTKIAFSYDAAPDKYAGAIGFAFGPPVKRVGIEVAGELTKGKVTSASITATFSKRLGDARFPLSLPGIPLPPSGVGPFFLSSINATVTNPCYLFDACPGLYPTFATTAAITLAPTVKIAGQEYALWSGTLTGTFASFPMKIELSGKASLLGTVTGFAASATPGDPAVQVAQKAVKGLGVLDGAVGLELSGGDDFKVYLKGGLTINNPFGDPAALGPLAEARIDTSITRVGNNFKGNASLSGALYVPKFKIFGVAFGGTKYAGGTAIMRTQSLPGTATDPAGEVSGDVILGTGVFGDSNFHIDMSFEKGVFAWINNKYAGFVPIGYVAGMLGSYQVTPPSAPSIALDATSGEQVFEYDGTNPDIELGVPAENLWLQIEHVGPATFDLQLPDGSVVTHDAVVADPGEARAFYLEGAGLEGQTQRTTWSVPMAAAGAYHVLVVDHPENVRRVLARVAPKPPSFVFDEPVTVADGAADIAWNATDDGAFSAELFYSPVDGGGDLIPITTIADPTATDHYSWSLTGVRPGTYAIVARVSDDDAPATLVRSRSTVRVDGAGGALPAPRLVREQAGVVSWLPVAGATSYLVHAEPLYRTPPFLAGLAGAGSPFTLPGAASSDTLELCRGGDLQLSAPTTRAAIPGFVSGCVFDVTIGVQDADGLAAFAPPVRVGLSTSLAPTTVPPRRARVGEEWSFRPHIAGVHELVAMTLAQGIAANVEGLTWTPTAADAGSSIEIGLAVRRPGKPLLLVDVFQVEVVGADQSVAPAIGGATRVDGVVGQALAAPIDVPSDAEVTLVDAPSGMTWNAASREVRWTPSSNAAIASAGEVSFTVRATVPGVDAPSERTFLVHFADRDGDGLSDAYELASGLDAEAANASSADGDGDGLSDLIEDQRGLRGDAKDSDGDGLEDGAENTAGTDPRSVDTDGDGLVDGAEAAKGADPTKADSDGDGVSDGDEVAAGTDPAHAPADTDGDGLNDEAEARLGTDPAVADSDGDGCADGVEDNVKKSNPGTADTDGDGADDCAERDAGTDPLVGGVDSDADGLSNDLEVVIGTAPSSADSDGDGWEDGIEVAFGSDPTLGDSKPPEDAPGANVAQMLRGSSTPLELTRAQVVDAGEIEVFPDADHDGAPDDYEELYGYDPANPADGASDDDGDGIPMWRESRYGTDPKKADSDGDGANDLDEIQAGTDPKDPGSKPSTGPITSIEVYPPKAGVVSNTIIGAGHLQLIVVGKRDDGSSADLTPATRGTTYSVDPVDAGAVSADGYFTAASTYEGPARVMVASGTLSGACDLVLSSFTPKLLASLPVPGANGRVAVAGPWVLVATSYGVALVDASVPGVPVVRGKLDLGAVSDVALRGTLGAAALGEGGVAWFDLGDPDHLLMLGKVPLEKPARALTLLDDRLVVATDAGFQLVRLADGGVGLLDVDGDGKDDRLLESLYPGTAFTTIDRDATYVVAGTTTGTLIVARITPGGLVPDRAISTGTAPIADAVVRGNVAAVALGTGGIARVSLAGAGAVVASDKTLNCQALDATGDLVVAANQVFTNPIALYSAQIPDQLPLVGAVQASGTLFSGLAVDRQYFYVVAPGVLQIGQHSVFSDLLGVPPRIVPQSPAPGAEFDEGAVVRFAVSASDDVAVDGVTLTLDDETLASFDQPPYAVTRQLDNVRVPTEVTVGATAFDPGQNIGTMTPYTITVRPVNDTTPPTGNFLLPIADELVASGHPFPVSINALDDYQVDAIELRVDGVLQKRLESPPWTTTIDAPTTTADPDGNVLVEATIIDFGENATKIAQNVIATGVDLVGDGVLTIGPGDTTYDGKDVLVDRGTVAISGAHSFHRFYVGPTGVVSQPPTLPSQPVSTTALTADLMVVVRGGAIDVSGQGFRGDCAAGDDSCGGGAHTVGNVGSGAGPRNGGAHGGDAGVSGNGARTAPYDDWVHPALPGSGGGYGCGGGEPGGSGGGVLAITATRLQVDGVIRADGARGGDTAGCPSVSGGGGGGALDLDIGTLTGSGPITADGGSGGAAGGGGRLALHYDDATGYALGLVRARPGLGAVAPGGAGTVYLTTAGKTPLIRIDDDGRSDGVDDRAFGATPDTARLDLAADLVITGESRLVAVQPLTAKDVTLVGRARISPLETTVTAESVLDLQCT
ncbi:MAG: hypothetical protein U1F43_35320, partial [Myxococcota bacterium]